MSHLSELEQRLAEVRERALALATWERLESEAQMGRIAPLRTRFEETRESWMVEIVAPRLRMLARWLPHGGEVEYRSGGAGASMKCGWRKEMGLSASLAVSIAPTTGFGNAMVHVQPLFIPILEGNPPAASREFELSDRAGEALSEFLDDAIVAFAEAYFKAAEPTSPYQRDFFSIDPVCGMTVHHPSAAAVIEHEERRYYFCAASCAERFRANPERYAGRPPGEIGGMS